MGNRAKNLAAEAGSAGADGLGADAGVGGVGGVGGALPGIDEGASGSAGGGGAGGGGDAAAAGVADAAGADATGGGSIPGVDGAKTDGAKSYEAVQTVDVKLADAEVRALVAEAVAGVRAEFETIKSQHAAQLQKLSDQLKEEELRASGATRAAYQLQNEVADLRHSLRLAGSAVQDIYAESREAFDARISAAGKAMHDAARATMAAIDAAHGLAHDDVDGQIAAAEAIEHPETTLEDAIAKMNAARATYNDGEYRLRKELELAENAWRRAMEVRQHHGVKFDGVVGRVKSFAIAASH